MQDYLHIIIYTLYGITSKVYLLYFGYDMQYNLFSGKKVTHAVTAFYHVIL